MNEKLKALIAALREELQAYGEMLALLDQQQELVFARAANELFQSVGEVQAQTGALEHVRGHRSLCQADLALAMDLSASASFGELIPSLPMDYRPLLLALVDENNQLLQRIHDRVRQNHLLLSRSLEMMQELINGLAPAQGVRVYDDRGRHFTRSMAAPSLYQAVG